MTFDGSFVLAEEIIKVVGRAGKIQQKLEAAGLNVEVGMDPYDVGYWSRVAGEKKPRAVGPLRKHITGWNDADRELRSEGPK